MMQIKIIKKGSVINESDNSAKLNINNASKGIKKLEKRVESNISQWVTELRSKKQLDLLQTQQFLSGFGGRA